MILDQSGDILACNQAWRESQPPLLTADLEAPLNFLDIIRDGYFTFPSEHIAELLALFADIVSGADARQMDIPTDVAAGRLRCLTLKLSSLRFSEQPDILLRAHVAKQPCVKDADLPPGLVRTLIEKMPIPLSICDTKLRYRWANERFQKMFFLTREKIIGRSIVEGPRPVNESELRNLFQKVIGTAREQRAIVKVHAGDSVITIENILVPVLGSDGKTEFIVTASVDLTRQVKTQEARSAAYDLLNDVLERMPVGLVATDEHFHILRMNRIARKLFEYENEDIIGSSVNVLIPERYHLRHDKLMSDFAQSVDSSLLMDVKREVIGKKASGEEFPIMSSVLKMTLGDFPLYCVMIVDLTQIRNAERRLLENEQQIQRIQKQEALGQLAGNIAHDFNNLMAIILGYADIIQGSEESSGSIREMTAEISRAVQRGVGLTRQILAYAKHQNLEVQPVNMLELLRENSSIIQSALTAAVKLETHFPHDPLYVDIDENQFMQVIVNLAVNARDAIPLGGVFAISTEKKYLGEEFFAEKSIQPAVGDYLILTVRDNGIGMQPEVMQRIFDPYFSTKPRDKGTGLGLSVVYGIVKQHKGFIFCDSSLGVGTVFTIYLPVSHNRPKFGGDELPVVHVTSEQELFSQVSILVVEDEKPLRELTMQQLSDAGFQVYSAENGRAAIRFIDNYPGNLDIILSDIMMPEMNGLEMAAEALLMQPETTFIFMSGYSREILNARKRNWPFRLLTKPYSKDRLLYEILQVLQEKPAYKNFFIAADDVRK